MEGKPAKRKPDLQNGNRNHKMEAGTTKWKPEQQMEGSKMETGMGHGRNESSVLNKVRFRVQRNVIANQDVGH